MLPQFSLAYSEQNILTVFFDVLCAASCCRLRFLDYSLHLLCTQLLHLVAFDVASNNAFDLLFPKKSSPDDDVASQDVPRDAIHPLHHHSLMSVSVVACQFVIFALA